MGIEGSFGKRFSGELNRMKGETHKRTIKEAILYEQVSAQLFGNAYENNLVARNHLKLASTISPNHRGSMEYLQNTIEASAVDAYDLPSNN